MWLADVQKYSFSVWPANKLYGTLNLLCENVNNKCRRSLPNRTVVRWKNSHPYIIENKMNQNVSDLCVCMLWQHINSEMRNRKGKAMMERQEEKRQQSIFITSVLLWLLCWLVVLQNIRHLYESTLSVILFCFVFLA